MQSSTSDLTKDPQTKLISLSPSKQSIIAPSLPLCQVRGLEPKEDFISYLVDTGRPLLNKSKSQGTLGTNVDSEDAKLAW